MHREINQPLMVIKSKKIDDAIRKQLDKIAHSTLRTV